MLRKSEKIKIFIGFLIVTGIFIFIGISSYIEKMNNFDDLVNCDTKFAASLSNNYCEDVMDVNSLNVDDLKVDKDEKVIGFSLGTNSNDAFQIVKSKLLDNGWNYVQSGNGTSASFYKDSETHNWLFVNCVDVSGVSSVVITRD